MGLKRPGRCHSPTRTGHGRRFQTRGSRAVSHPRLPGRNDRRHAGEKGRGRNLMLPSAIPGGAETRRTGPTHGRATKESPPFKTGRKIKDTSAEDVCCVVRSRGPGTTDPVSYTHLTLPT